MWVTNALAGVCDLGTSIFNTLEENFAGVPVIGGTLAAPFGYFGDRLQDGEEFFYGFGLWCDDRIDDIREIFTEIANLVGGVFDLGNWADIAGGVIDSLQEGAGNFVNAVLDVLGPVWVDLKNLLGNFAGEVFDVLGTAWDNLMWLYDNFNELVADVLEGAVMRFIYAGTYISGSVVGFITEIYMNAKDIIENWVDYVYAGVINWTETQYEDVATKLIEVVGIAFERLEDSITWLLVKSVELIDRQWTIFEDYMLFLTFKILNIIADQAETFSDKLWDIVEKILEKI